MARGSLDIASAALLLAGALAVSARAEEIEIRGQLLTGRVQPLAGAEVMLLPLVDDPRVDAAGTSSTQIAQPVAHALSDEQGRFRLLAPAAGFWEIVARSPGRLEMRLPLAPLLENLELPRAILPQGQLVTIQVRDAEGRPVAGAQVVAGGTSGTDAVWRPAPRFATTDADGRAYAGGLRNEGFAAVALTASHLGWGRLERRSHQIELVLDHALRPAQLLAGGRPVAGAVISLERPRLALATSDARGVLPLPRETGSLPLLLERGLFAERLPPVEPATDPEGLPTLRLPPLNEVVLAVIEAQTGAPIAGAWIWQPALGRHAGRARTDSQGELRLAIPEGMPAQLEIASPRFQTERLTLPGIPTGNGKITAALISFVALGGRARDVAGRPVAGAQIKLEPGPGATLPEEAPRFDGRPITDGTRTQTRTDGEGGFFFPRVVAGLPYLLSVRQAGFAPFRLMLPAPAAGTRLAPLELVLEPGVSATGRILDDRERPLAEAQVFLIAETGSRDLALGRLPPLEWHTRTDADGRFGLADLPAGPCVLVARAEGFADLTVPGLVLEPSAEATDLGELLLERGWGLEGEVVDPRGDPVAGAQVIARRSDLERRPIRVDGLDGDRSTVTDTHGRFRIGGVPSGAVLELELHKEPFRVRKVEGVRPDLEPWLRIAFEIDTRIVGKVIDAGKHPVGGAEVFLEQPREGPDVQTTLTDATGRFVFDPVHPGETRISARAPSGVAAPQQVIVNGSGETVELLVELEPALGITGLVFDARDGRPIEGAVVAAHPSRRNDDAEGAQIPGPVETWTEEDGRFLLAGLTLGRYQVVCEHSAFKKEVVEIELKRGDPPQLPCALHPSGERRLRRIAGWVVDSAGSRVGGATVRLIDAGRGIELRRVTSWPDGSFELRTRPPALVELSAHHQGLASAKSDPIELLTQDIEGVVLTLSSGGVISGRILDIPLAELGAVEVVAQNADGARYRGEVAWDGGYRIENLPAGEWVVTAITPTRRHTHPEKQTLLGDDHGLELDLPLGEGTRWRGEVFFEGRLAAGVKIDVRCPEVGLAFSVTSRDDGSFVLYDLPHFGCRLRLGYGGADQQLELLLDGGRLVRLAGGEVVADGATGFALELAPWR